MGDRIPDRDPITGVELVRAAPFATSEGFRFRGQGFSGTALAGQVTQIQHKLTEERFFNGLGIILQNHVYGDHGNLKIVDVDNVLGYGANTVLDEFANSWFFNPSSACQGANLMPYPAKILAGLYLVVEYHSTGAQDVNIEVNAFLHKKTA